jgi:trehalose 6-phosphate phosphatase
MNSGSKERHAWIARDCELVQSALPAVLLDLDGTLLELAPRPDEVDVPPGLPGLLEELATRLQGALAIVSGRPIDSIDALLAPFRSPAAGLHGAQMRPSSSSPIVSTVLATSPHAVIERIPSLMAGSHAVLLEDKGACLAIHHRFTPDTLKAITTELLATIAEHAPDLDLLEGRRVLEIKPRAIDKGVACRHLLAAAPFHGRKAFYFGDDTTDIAAFRFVDSIGGTSIAVGSRVGSDASVRMSGPSGVLRWLEVLRDDLRSSPCSS